MHPSDGASTHNAKDSYPKLVLLIGRQSYTADREENVGTHTVFLIVESLTCCLMDRINQVIIVNRTGRSICRRPWAPSRRG
jgi:hypothetical protein